MNVRSLKCELDLSSVSQPGFGSLSLSPATRGSTLTIMWAERCASLRPGLPQRPSSSLWTCPPCPARVQTISSGSAALKASPCSKWCLSQLNAFATRFVLVPACNPMLCVTCFFFLLHRTDKKFSFTASPSQPQVCCRMSLCACAIHYEAGLRFTGRSRVENRNGATQMRKHEKKPWKVQVKKRWWEDMRENPILRNDSACGDITSVLLFIPWKRRRRRSSLWLLRFVTLPR